MRQLTLDVQLDRQATFNNFAGQNNHELLVRLKALASPGSFEALYLFGPSGSGRTHLLEATCALARQHGRECRMADASQVGRDLPLPTQGLLAVDDIDQLNADAQIALFRAFNSMRLSGCALLLAGSKPPRDLALREDLRTRVGSALIYEVRPLSDPEKAEALAEHAHSRGMRVSEDIIGYLMRHGRRDLPSLLAVLDALDRTTLEQQRPITLPLLRQIMQLPLEADDLS